MNNYAMKSNGLSKKKMLSRINPMLKKTAPQSKKNNNYFRIIDNCMTYRAFFYNCTNRKLQKTREISCAILCNYRLNFEGGNFSQ